MATDRYDEERLASDIAAIDGTPVFIAYNANVDAIVRVDETLEAPLDRPQEPGIATPPSPLESERDLAIAITHTMASGRGDEVAMSNEFSARLESEMIPDTQQMGGQAGIMTNLVTALGAESITYTYLLSDRQLSLFEHAEKVRYPIVEDGRAAYVPLNDAVNSDRTKINWVFEFKDGDELFDVKANADSRFIAASRPPEFDLMTGELDTVIDQVGAEVSGALLAGYHNLTPEHVDESYEATQQHAREVLRRLKSGGNVEVHVEYAVTHDDDLRESIYEWILPEADVIGADTHELGLLHSDADLQAVDEVPQESTPFEPTEILAHYRMLSAIQEELGVDCIQLHAMEYHLAVLNRDVSSEAVLHGLEFSAVNAASKAALGSITAPKDLNTGLEYAPSKGGQEAIELLATHLDASAENGLLATQTVAACPNRVVRDPVGTVGIGDIVSSSSFVRQLAITSATRKDS